MAAPTPPPVQLVPGQQPTPEQLQTIQAHFRKEAEQMGLSYEEYIERVKEQARLQQEAHHQHQQEHQQQQHQEPIQPGPPKPEALAVAKFLKSHDMKPRTCIFQEKRNDMFRVKRAIRLLESPVYEAARVKNSLLPQVTNRAEAENVFKLLPLSMLALRVEKVDEEHGHEGHNHAKKKRIKGLWTVQIVQQQDCGDDMHYMWLWEGSQWKQKAYALAALAAVITLVMFPLWPLVMRQGVWYLSMGMLGLVGVFFIMAIFRLILFCITVFSHPPGLWLFPNLFEDVGFFDSFKPLWGWQEDKKAKKRAKLEKKAEKAVRGSKDGAKGEAVGSEQAVSSGADTENAGVSQRVLRASVEEAEDE